MVQVLGFEIPEDLYYDVKNHVWLKILDDGNVRIGLDDVGQALAKRILFVRLRRKGAKIAKGKAIATLESAKWVGPVPSPVSGVIVEVNEELRRKPSLINEEPYGKGWIAVIKPDNLDEDIKDLVTGEEALKLQEEDIKKRGVTKE